MFQLRDCAAIAFVAFVVNCGGFGIQGSLDFHGALIDSAKDETPSATTVPVLNRLSESTSIPIQTSTITSERTCTKSTAPVTLFTPRSVAYPSSNARSTPISSSQPLQKSVSKSIETSYSLQNSSTPVPASRTPVASKNPPSPWSPHFSSGLPMTGSTIPTYMPSTSSPSLEGERPTQSPSDLGTNSTQLVSGASPKRIPSKILLELATVASFYLLCI